jgi:hypothetical protein
MRRSFATSCTDHHPAQPVTGTLKAAEGRTYTGRVRALALILALCLVTTSCADPLGSGTVHHSKWYRLAYKQCSKMARSPFPNLAGPGTMVVPPGTVHHWDDWKAGCGAAARAAGYLDLRGSKP